MDMVNEALWGRFGFAGLVAGRRNADSMRSDDAGYALGLRLDRAYLARPVRSNKSWSPRQSLMFIVGTSAFLWAVIIWACIHYL
jgi:hypothetical protein